MTTGSERRVGWITGVCGTTVSRVTVPSQRKRRVRRAEPGARIRVALRLPEDLADEVRTAARAARVTDNRLLIEMIRLGLAERARRVPGELPIGTP